MMLSAQLLQSIALPCWRCPFGSGIQQRSVLHDDVTAWKRFPHQLIALYQTQDIFLCRYKGNKYMQNFTLFRNFADPCLQNDPFFSISRIRASLFRENGYESGMLFGREGAMHMHLLQNLVFPAQIRNKLSYRQTKFPRNLNQNGQNDIEVHGNELHFQYHAAESIPRCLYANLVILAQICDGHMGGMRLRTNFAAESRVVTWSCGDRIVSRETYCVAYNLKGVCRITF